MAKSKSFFGLRTGSTKSLTFQVYRGQQITKDRVYRVSNPRTEAQMTQRALIPIVAAARSALRGLVDHSFEGVAYGDQSLKMFSSLNLKAGALKVASFSPNGYSNPGFADLIVSRGTIKIDLEVGNNVSYAFARYGEMGDADNMPHKAYKDGEPITGFLRELATWANSTGMEICKPGTQLTFLNMMKAGVLDEPRAELSAFHINRILFPSDSTLSSQVEDVNGPWKFKGNVSESATNMRIENTIKDIIEIHIEHGQIAFTVKPFGYETSRGMAVIVSKYVNGQWRRNNARIEMISDPDPIYTYEQWRATYEKTGASSKYLNQGDEGTGIA